ncbi:MAG: GH3 auxin-responsive promoter family protein [Chitinophagales bacterium]|nr:GH3 auxin-responsive promoter family protein [Chitinophagales bacterium]MCZ2394732.1 GH3 auxin-responsive promoter family protein [Chitinophagales bacterium]
MWNLKNVAIREFMIWRSAQVRNDSKSALLHQNKWLFELLNLASQTVYGKKYHFDQIKSYQDFKNALPICDYEDLKSTFELTLQGEQNVFWHENIHWFAKSSGTTSDKSKFIPVSKSTLNTAHYKGAFDITSQYCFNCPQTNIFNGKTMIVSGSQKEASSKSRIRVGDISAIMVHQQPFLADFLRTPDKSIALMEDFEEKLSIVAQNSIFENVTSLAGVPTWNIVLLKKVLKNTGKVHINEIWPNLELYIHGGVNFEPHRSMFEQLIPSGNMNYLQVYNASEGFFAFQDRLFADDMLLATHHGIFYEFIPLDQVHLKFPEILSLDEVETGKQYAIVITTNSGLWRYKIGDTIQFTSTSPYRIKVTGRTKYFINAFGEELVEENADTAIMHAAHVTHAIVKHYTVAPKFANNDENGGHEWIIEFEKYPYNEKIFIDELDKSLKMSNSDYEAKRFKDLAMSAPIVHIAPQDLFYKWLKSKEKIGAQNKVPKLSNDRIMIEELFKLKEC